VVETVRLLFLVFDAQILIIDIQYMMLQLFGYLSGDKRLYELTEAIHGQMIQVRLIQYW
jgi:hypothetical protein